jgi:hypothetical protein
MFPCDQPQVKNFRNWPAAFIRDNFPVLGYFAWSGFEHHGWGVLWCQIERPETDQELRCHSWQFTTQFVPGQSLPGCFQSLAISAMENSQLVETIARYHPQQEMILLIQSGESVEVLWLQNLAITPPECYQQVCDRWDEFMPNTFFGQKMGNINL